MKYTITLMFLILITLTSQTSYALCGMSNIKNASHCEANAETVCCVIEEDSCIEAWCYSQDECEWKLAIPKTCS